MNILAVSHLSGAERQLTEFISAHKLGDERVLFIPTAGNVEVFTGYIKDSKKLFDKLGFAVDILDVAKESAEVCSQRIREARIIFISGGNTFYLLQELQRKNLIPALSKAIRTDSCAYIGESAGSIILSKNIEYAHFMDDVKQAPEIQNFSALGVVDVYPLPHYIEPPFTESVKQTFETYRNTLNLLPINNQQAIVVDDNDAIIVR